MGSWYINRTFFFDVHPPLGKMLIALSGKLTGYDGTYPFEKPSDKYNGTHYEGMRIVSKRRLHMCARISIERSFQFCTALGAAIAPMAFETVADLTGSVQAGFIAAVYIIFGE